MRLKYQQILTRTFKDLEYLFFRNAKIGIVRISMGALMNDAICVQIEVIKLRNLRGRRDITKARTEKQEEQTSCSRTIWLKHGYRSDTQR